MAHCGSGWPRSFRILVQAVSQVTTTSYKDKPARSHCRSWVGASGDASWLVKTFGDVYLHETMVSHVRRLLDGDFASNKLAESPAQLAKRMQRVGPYEFLLFCRPWRTWLNGSKELRTRCELVIASKGQRVPK